MLLRSSDSLENNVISAERGYMAQWLTPPNLAVNAMLIAVSGIAISDDIDTPTAI
jgi:hypothetical protein